MAKLIDTTLGAAVAYQADDALIVEWDYTEEVPDSGPAGTVHPYPYPGMVEVRIGKSWVYSHFVCRHWCRRLVLRDHWTVGGQSVWIRPLGLNGWYASEALEVPVTMVAPPSHVGVGSKDHRAGGSGFVDWTLSNVVVDGTTGNLRLDTAQLSGTGTSPASGANVMDFGADKVWRVGSRVGMLFEDSGFTWASLETTWAELDAAGTTWEDLKHTSWADLNKTWDSQEMRERDWLDNIYNPRAGVIVECRASSSSPVTGTWRRHVPGRLYKGRYFQIRITLLRANATDHKIEIDDCLTSWSRPAQGDGDVTGPSSSVDARIATFSGTSGKIIQDSGTLISDLAEAVHSHDLSGGSIVGILPLSKGGTGEDLFASVAAGNIVEMNDEQTAFEDAGKASADLVTGPASSVDARVAVFNGTTGKVIADGGKTLPTGDIVGTTDTQTLTNKTYSGGTMSGTWAGGPVAASGLIFNPGPQIWVGIFVNCSAGPDFYIKDATLTKVATIRLNSGWTAGTRTIDIPAITAADYFALRGIDNVFSARQSFLAGLRIEDDDASPQYVEIDVAAQTTDRTATIPALGGNRTFDFIDEAQTVSARKTFTSSPGIRSTGSNSVLIANSTESAERTATIPVLGGNKTFDMIDLAQTISAVKTFTAAPAIKTAGSNAVSIKNTTETGARDATIPALGANANFVMSESSSNQTVNANVYFTGELGAPTGTGTPGGDPGAIYVYDDSLGTGEVRIRVTADDGSTYETADMTSV